jgi:hypothetical protein
VLVFIIAIEIIMLKYKHLLYLQTVFPRKHFHGEINGNCPLPQMESELHMTPTEEREKLLHSISTIHISAEHSLAMKANLQIPWNKLRLMRRWMKSWNIQIASERSLRERAANLVIDEFVAEEALFSSGDELKSAPIVYVPHLKNKIFDLLNKHDK